MLNKGTISNLVEKSPINSTNPNIYIKNLLITDVNDLISDAIASKLIKSNKNNLDTNSTHTDNIQDLKIRTDKLFLIILLIAVITYVLNSLLKINFNINYLNSLYIANKIALNIHDRFSNFAQLILYYKTSILMNNLTYILSDKSEYNSSYSNLYNVSIDTQTETFYKELSSSEFTLILYNLQENKENIKLFLMDSSSSNILTETAQYESYLNTNDMCFFLSQYFINLDNTLSTLDAFKNADSIVGNCKMKINQNGLNTGLDTQINILKNNYLDYYLTKNESTRINHLTSMDINRSVLNLEYNYKKIHYTSMNLILKDMSTYYNTIENNEFIFSILGFIFDIFFVFFVLIVIIGKLKAYKNSLEQISIRFKKILNSLQN